MVSITIMIRYFLQPKLEECDEFFLDETSSNPDLFLWGYVNKFQPIEQLKDGIAQISVKLCGKVMKNMLEKAIKQQEYRGIIFYSKKKKTLIRLFFKFCNFR